ncbi:MAG TPA: AraC family transcriptional regulator, partial [Gillisia sp.]|nr:AraC family transcriptional regulator [Gillisia sp.]
NLPKILRQRDIENVKKAIEIVKANLDTNLSIDHLANEVGTNVNKLQEGFKYMYDLTVNKYMQHLKLEIAKEMLESSDNNISQIVNLIGLNNRSYFSKVFKEKYHVSPKYFLRSNREKDVKENEN